MTSWALREATSNDADLAAIMRIVNEVTPENPTSLDELHWQDANYPGARFVAETDGTIVAMATTGRIYMYGPEYERYWLGLCVLPPYRRKGIGSALYRSVSEYARAAGKTGLQTNVIETQVDGLAFLLHRGWEETERAKLVRLDLAGQAPPALPSVAGVEFTTLGERPALVATIHRVAVLAFADIPSAGEPVAAGSFEEFRARDVDRPGIPPEAFQVAVDPATGDAVGYAAMQFLPGRTDVAWHDMTAVHPAWRGRGIATALKARAIAWAIEAGLTALETGNDTENAPMRAVNARLGYRPMPDEISLRGPLTGPTGQP
jgi:GNAT superfamily N-acetyltransferase